ncbi:MAG: hypothetical protein JW878_08380 [Methanomicrobia archaeon]|nr:hypothetical protein [Methanomicrobia archaeon]
MIQKDIKIVSGNSTYYSFLGIKDKDSWEDFSNQDPELGIYTPPEHFTNAAIVNCDNGESWVIVYNHDIPSDSVMS